MKKAAMQINNEYINLQQKISSSGPHSIVADASSGLQAQMLPLNKAQS